MLSSVFMYHISNKLGRVKTISPLLGDGPYIRLSPFLLGVTKESLLEQLRKSSERKGISYGRSIGNSSWRSGTKIGLYHICPLNFSVSNIYDIALQKT